MSRVLHAIRFATAETERTDGQLLEAYSAHRDEAAFAELVRRHGPMVRGVCQRLLANRQDAEDAFQATFLVLVRKPGAVRPAERVGNWLHGVAVRAARKAGTTVARRRERQVESLPEPETVAEGIWHDLIPVLDEAITCLPEKYRLPVVLCDLEGLTRREAAARLDWPEGTVAGRLALGRTMLARRLTRHGLAVSGGVLAAVLSGGSARATVPMSLLDSIVRAAGSGSFRPAVATLAEEVLRAMSVTRLMVLAAVMVATAVGGGMVLWAQPSPGVQPQEPVKPNPAKAVAKELAVDVAWGKEVNGLQAGVGFAPGRKGPFRVGQTATLIVLLRNVSDKEMTVEYTDGYLAENQPKVIDAAGKPVETSQLPSLKGIWRILKMKLAAGEVAELGRVERLLAPKSDKGNGKPAIYTGPGRYKLSYSGVPPHRENAPGLSTGVLDLEVVTDALTPVFGQDGWRFAVTYWNTTAAKVDLPALLMASSIVLDGKEYPRQILKFGGGAKLPPGENFTLIIGPTEYLTETNAVVAEGKHTLTLKFGGQEFGPVEFELWK